MQHVASVTLLALLLVACGCNAGSTPVRPSVVWQARPEEAQVDMSENRFVKTFVAAKDPEHKIDCLLAVYQEEGDRARAVFQELRHQCSCLAFDDQLKACIFQDRDDPKTFLVKPHDKKWQELPCEPFTELESVGWVDGACFFVGRRKGDEQFHTIAIHFFESGAFFFAAFGTLSEDEYRQVQKAGLWPAKWQWRG